MRRWMSSLLFVALVVVAIPASALSPGTDVFVPAAARAGDWITDLYVFNHGDQSTSLTIYWMVRDQANTSPTGESFNLGPGEALVLEDVILDTFGMNSGAGAFRVVSDYPVVVNSRIYNLKNGVTFGQGFEGLPRSGAVAVGATTDIVGLANSTTFRTNLVAMDASGDSSTVVFTLYDESGTQIATRNWALGAFEPRLKPITSVFSGLTSFDYATLHVEVTKGSVFVVASKVDNDASTGDPTTLEAWSSSCGDQDGTYQIVLYDSLYYGAGGYLEIDSNMVTYLLASYLNYDKGSDPDNPDCDLLFLFGGASLDVYSLDDYAQGVTFSQSFSDSGTLTFTVTFDLTDNMTIDGTVDAVGTDFTGDETGCNGTFPTLTLRGGKSSS